MTITAGLDVGGAHLKVSLTEAGRVLDVRQFVCPLWQGLDKLDAALIEASPLLSQAERFAITMTGELSDLFPDRPAGVETLVTRLSREFDGDPCLFWMGPFGFGSARAAISNPAAVGSTNFLASAKLAATRCSDGLLIDFGSTTADIIPVRDGAPALQGVTDATRQATGELVYTGYTRTPVMGVTQRVPFAGKWVSLAREYLATMADIRRILGMLDESLDLHATADGKGKSVPESIARFARMLGRDAADGARAEWDTSAAYVREEQLRSLHDGTLQVLSLVGLPAGAPVIAAGTGAVEIAEIARRLDRPVRAFASLLDCAPGCQAPASHAAPAVAVALLSERA